jgi:hypothetical protein
MLAGEIALQDKVLLNNQEAMMAVAEAEAQEDN